MGRTATESDMFRDDSKLWDFICETMLVLVCIAVTGWAAIELIFYLIR
jgi:hypothetical protein